MTALGLAACGPVPGRFVVKSVGDGADASLNGTCATSSGDCTLRAAIQEANSNAGHDTIAFEISAQGPQTIAPTTALPFITDPAGVTIDGYTQPNATTNTDPTTSNAVIRIQLQGPGRTSGVDGLDLRSPSNVVRGLAVWNFTQQIRIFGTNAHDNEVVGNFVGTNAGASVGAASYVPGSMGVHLQAGAHHNRIGKPGAADRNVISGNSQHGIATYDDLTDFNVIQNNIIGLRPDGRAALPNRSHGIDINTYSADNLVGGDEEGEGNVLSGNSQNGIEISHGAGTVRNDIVGNLIGAAPGGATAPAYAANGEFGVDLQGVGDPNVDCSATCPEDAGLSEVRGNVIVNSGFRGILITGGDHDNVITENWIGVLPNAAAAPNRLAGVQLEKGTFGNRIGPGNIIANNPVGVVVVPYGTDPASPREVPTNGNTITQNSIRGHSGLGIDLAPTGLVTPNPSSNVNDGAAIPVSTAQTSTTVVYQTCSGCTVEVFVSDGPVGTYGEGAEFVASRVADQLGVAVVPLPPKAQGWIATATATHAGNTSEFSQNVLIPPGS